LAGSAGKDGKNGVDGKPGLNGAAGKDGKNGVDGKAGADGKPGVAGSAGKDGKNGVDGKPGLNGAAGKDGKNGVDGKAGPAGAPGKDGKNGVDGKPGVAGPVGPKGDQGPAGSDLRTGARDITALLKLPDAARLDNAVLRRVGDTVELSLSGLRSKKRIDAVLGKVPVGFRPARHQSLCTSDVDFEQVRVSVDAEGSAAITAAQPKQAAGLASTSTSLVWLTDDEWPTKLPGKDWR
jgi:hypothetical protein